MNIVALYLREIRGWRHRFWWLPLAGLAGVLLPLALAPLRRSSAGRQYWEEWSDPSFLWPPIPQQALAIVVVALIALAFLLAMWLARELRAGEVRNNTLPDLAITTVRAGELAVAQIAAAWTIAGMLVVGALPVLVPFGARVGRAPLELLLGVGLLLLAPLCGACLGYALCWWKRLVLVAGRGRSFRLWMIPFTLAALIACGTVARPLTIPWWRDASASARLSYWYQWDQGGSYGTEMFMSNLVLGIWLLAVLWLLVAAANALWQQRWKGRLLLATIAAATIVIASSSPRVVKLRAGGAERALAWGKRFAPTPMPRWGPSSLIDVAIMRADLYAAAIPLLPLVATAHVLGADLNFSRERGGGRARIDDALPAMVMLGAAYWGTLTLAAFVFALGDLGWILRRPWLIEALRRPEIAPFMLEFGGRVPKRRVGTYVFATRNPIFDYALARSSGSRVVLMALVGAGVLGFTFYKFITWKQFVEQQPIQDRSGEVLLIGFGVALLCWLCGVNGGLMMAHLKTSQQWWSLLSLPMRFRTLMWGLWLPRFIDAIVIVCIGVALVVTQTMFAPAALNEFALGDTITTVSLALVGIVVGILLLGTATSTFAASWSRGPTKATVLTVILSTLIGLVLPCGLIALLEWQHGKSEVNTWRLVFTETHENELRNSTVLAAIIAPLTSCLILSCWGVRRLKRGQM